MKLEGDQVQLPVFLNICKNRHHPPLHEGIVEKSRKVHMAGATAPIGLEGFGQDVVLLQEILNRHGT